MFWLFAGLILAGCGAGSVISGDENTVVVSGASARGAAERHCAQFGKLAVISAQPQPGGRVLYRCI